MIKIKGKRGRKEVREKNEKQKVRVSRLKD